MLSYPTFCLLNSHFLDSHLLGFYISSTVHLFTIERPQTQWTKERLPELLTTVKIPCEDGFIQIKSVDSIDGDATINVRKGKRIVTYELKLKASWKGQFGPKDDEKTASGKIEMPYICEDVDDLKYESLLSYIFLKLFSQYILSDFSSCHHRFFKRSL